MELQRGGVHLILLSGSNARTAFEGQPNVVAALGGDLDLAGLLVPTDQAKLFQDGG